MASYEQAKALLRNSVSRPTFYSLELHSPKISDILGNDERKLVNDYFRMFINNISFPGVDLEQVTSLGQENMGVVRTQPTGMMYGQSNKLIFNVIENSDFFAYDIIRRIFNSAVSQGSNAKGSGRTQRMNYYDRYVFNATLTKLELPNSATSVPTNGRESNTLIDYAYKVVETFTFENCFISSIGPLMLDSSAENTFTTYSVNMRYESYHQDNKKFHSGGAGDGR